jgi:hypothetical protein
MRQLDANKDTATVYRQDPVWNTNQPWWKLSGPDLERLYVEDWEIDLRERDKHLAYIRSQYAFPVVIVSL